MKPIILSTKLIVPELKDDILVRERLLKILQNSVKRKLILITAPPGYGKTTLLASFIKKTKFRVAFYTLDERDTDIIIFLYHLIESIRKTYPEFGEEVIDVIKTSPNIENNINLLVITFINELVKFITEEFIIILDFSVAIQPKLVNHFLFSILKNLPPNIHFIIATQEKELFSLVEFKAKGELIEIREDELQFTVQEIDELFQKIYNLKITPQIIEKINNQTEGWITAIQLLVQDLQTKKGVIEIGKSAYKKNIFEYFDTIMFSKLSQDVQNFLIKSSILRELNLEILAKLFPQVNFSEIFNNLSFVSKTDKGFKYHQLFRDFLDKKLYELINKKEITKLHLRAAKLFEKQNITSAIEHYSKATYYDKCAELITQHAEELFEQGMLETFNLWISNIPKYIQKKYPYIIFWQANILFIYNKLDEALKIYKKIYIKSKKQQDNRLTHYAVWGISKILVKQGEIKKAQQLIKSVINNVKDSNIETNLLNILASTYFLQEDYFRAKKYWTKCRKLCKKTKQTSLLALIYGNLGLVALKESNFSTALDYTYQLLKIAPRHQLPMVYNSIGAIEMTKAELQKAKESLNKGISYAVKYDDKLSLAYLFSNMSKVYYSEGNLEQSLIELHKAIELAKEVKGNILYPSLIRQRSNIYITNKEFYEARRELEEAFSLVKKNTILYGELLLTKIRLRIQIKQPIQEYFSLVSQIVKKTRDKNLLIQLYYLRAMSAYRSQNFSSVKRYLHTMFKLSMQYEYHNFILTSAIEDFTLFQFALKNKIELHYLLFIFSKSNKFVEKMNFLKETHDPELNEWYGTFLDKIKIKPKVITTIPSKFRIKLFGEFRIIDSNNQLVTINWRSVKMKSLFCYLLLSRERGISKDKLMEMFWSDSKPKIQSANLRSTISELRKELSSVFGQKRKDIIQYQYQTYKFVPQVTLTVDTENFEKLINEIQKESKLKAKIEKCLLAVSLYEGDFLEELYDSWTDEYRRYYKEKYNYLLWQLADYYYNREEYWEAISYYRKILKIEPFSEKVYSQLMLAFSKLGNKEAIKETYIQLEQLFQEELDTKPSPTITSLFKRLIL